MLVQEWYRTTGFKETGLVYGDVIMNRMFQAFANAADGVLIINQDQHIIYWNQAAKIILGYSHTEVAGHPCYEILEGRDDQERLVCREYCRVAMMALHGGTVTNYDSSVRTKSGDIRWINMSTFILPTNGTKAGSALVHLFRDVSKKKQNEQFIEHVLTAANQLQNGELSRSNSSMSVEQQGSNLTDREGEVLALLAQGSSTANIAQSLFISPATVRIHIRNILQKFQVHSRLEAVIYAQQHGLIAKD
jgi:PAS domain S-box-containing protein